MYVQGYGNICDCQRYKIGKFGEGGGVVPTPILGRLILTKKGNLAIFMTTTPSSDKMVESIL